MPWTRPIRDGGVLRVHATPSVARGSWRAVFDQALQEFNRLSGAKGLGVRLERAPADDGAQVLVEAASRTIDREYEGVPIRHSFSGSALHGYTALVSRDGKIERAFVFLPSTPQVNTPRGPREAGPGVKLVIAVHELVHACGLTNAEHSNDDLFMGFPNVDAGTRPQGDRVRVSHSVVMPPLVLSTGTANRIRTLWG